MSIDLSTLGPSARKIAACVAMAALMLPACRVEHKPDPDPSMPDQCIRREIFFGCLAALPKGPENPRYNDWAEVVGECADVALYQSYRARSAIRVECRNQ